MTSDFARLGHLNLMEFAREQTRWSDEGIVHEEGGVLCFATATDFPVLMNGAHRLDDRVPATDVIERARAFFGERNRGFSLQLQVDAEADVVAAAEAAGLVKLFGAPEMICRQPLEPMNPPVGVRLKPVTDTDGVADFVTVNSAAYASLGMPAEVMTETITRPDRLINDYTATVVAYVDDEPLAAAQTIANHGIAGVYWVGTREEGRGKGLGELVTTWVTNAGFDMGGQVNTLQASPMGEPIYRRMGYEEIYGYVTYSALEPPTTVAR